MEKLISDLENAFKKLREECSKRGLPSSVTVTYYTDRVEQIEQAYIISGPHDLQQTNTFRGLVETLFMYETTEASECRFKGLSERNQKIIDSSEI